MEERINDIVDAINEIIPDYDKDDGDFTADDLTDALNGASDPNTILGIMETLIKYIDI